MGFSFDSALIGSGKEVAEKVPDIMLPLSANQTATYSISVTVSLPSPSIFSTQSLKGSRKEVARRKLQRSFLC